MGRATGVVKREFAGAVVTVLADCARAAANISDKAFCPALGKEGATLRVPYPCPANCTGAGAAGEISPGSGAGGGVAAIAAGLEAGEDGAISGGRGAGATPGTTDGTECAVADASFGILA